MPSRNPTRSRIRPRISTRTPPQSYPTPVRTNKPGLVRLLRGVRGAEVFAVGDRGHLDLGDPAVADHGELGRVQGRQWRVVGDGLREGDGAEVGEGGVVADDAVCFYDPLSGVALRAGDRLDG